MRSKIKQWLIISCFSGVIFVLIASFIISFWLENYISKQSRLFNTNNQLGITLQVSDYHRGFMESNFQLDVTDAQSNHYPYHVTIKHTPLFNHSFSWLRAQAKHQDSNVYVDLSLLFKLDAHGHLPLISFISQNSQGDLSASDFQFFGYLLTGDYQLDFNTQADTVLDIAHDNRHLLVTASPFTIRHKFAGHFLNLTALTPRLKIDYKDRDWPVITNLDNLSINYRWPLNENDPRLQIIMESDIQPIKIPLAVPLSTLPSHIKMIDYCPVNNHEPLQSMTHFCQPVVKLSKNGQTLIAIHQQDSRLMLNIEKPWLIESKLFFLLFNISKINHFHWKDDHEMIRLLIEI